MRSLPPTEEFVSAGSVNNRKSENGMTRIEKQMIGGMALVLMMGAVALTDGGITTDQARARAMAATKQGSAYLPASSPGIAPDQAPASLPLTAEADAISATPGR
jgi:mannose/fructose-specific phosphotransferase system component IIA